MRLLTRARLASVVVLSSLAFAAAFPTRARALSQDEAAPAPRITEEARALLTRMGQATYRATSEGLESLEGSLVMTMNPAAMAEMAGAGGTGPGMGAMPEMRFSFTVRFTSPGTLDVKAEDAQGMMAMLAGPMSEGVRSTLRRGLEGGYFSEGFVDEAGIEGAEVVEEGDQRTLVLHGGNQRAAGGEVRIVVDDRDLAVSLDSRGVTLPGISLQGGGMGGPGPGMGGLRGGRAGPGGGRPAGPGGAAEGKDVSISFTYGEAPRGYRVESATVNAGGMKVVQEYTYVSAGGLQVPSGWSMRLGKDAPALQTARFRALKVNGKPVALEGEGD